MAKLSRDKILLIEAISDSLLKRYDAAVDTVEGLVNNFSGKNVESVNSVLKPALDKTREELVTLSDARKQKGIQGFFRNLLQGDKKPALEKLEQIIKDLDNATRLAYKYTKSFLTKNQQATAVEFAKLGLDDADAKKLKTLLVNSFSDSSLRPVRKLAPKIAEEMFENLSLDSLKGLATELDGVAEAVSAAAEELVAVNKKVAPTTPKQDDQKEKLAQALGKSVGVDTKVQATASRVADKLEATPGTGDDMQVALNILSKLNDDQLKAVVSLIKRLKATPPAKK